MEVLLGGIFCHKSKESCQKVSGGLFRHKVKETVSDVCGGIGQSYWRKFLPGNLLAYVFLAERFRQEIFTFWRK
jgi:hypothetical protein